MLDPMRFGSSSHPHPLCQAWSPLPSRTVRDRLRPLSSPAPVTAPPPPKGLNVVIVSMDDKFLAETFATVTSQFPNLKFRKVGITFSPGVDYMSLIK